jgi:hypothetical protein
LLKSGGRSLVSLPVFAGVEVTLTGGLYIVNTAG